jgi:hypothetical protein
MPTRRLAPYEQRTIIVVAGPIWVKYEDIEQVECKRSWLSPRVDISARDPKVVASFNVCGFRSMPATSSGACRGSIPAPKVRILDLGGEDTKQLVRSDTSFLKPLFAELQLAELAAPKCDVLFLYAKLTAEGAVLGSTRSLREIIRDSGAKVVVVAFANPSGYYIKAGKQQPYGRANLVMTLNRCGDAFGRFFEALFSKMKVEGLCLSPGLS